MIKKTTVFPDKEEEITERAKKKKSEATGGRVENLERNGELGDLVGCHTHTRPTTIMPPLKNF